MKRPLILITNDDGVRAKGINLLYQAAMAYGDVVVIAPDECYSGMSHAITMHSPLFVNKLQESDGCTIYSCKGTPVDCIKIGLDSILLDSAPDLILSGINHGSNSNVSVIYSGTMGAASEGAMYKIPSIGFSLTDHDPDADFSGAIHYAAKIIEMVMNLPAPKGLCLNVNVPNIPLDQIEGIRICRQTMGNWREDFIHRLDPHGRDYYWMSGAFYNSEPLAEDTDEWALANKFVSVVPIQMDLTDYTRMAELKSVSF